MVDDTPHIEGVELDRQLHIGAHVTLLLPRSNANGLITSFSNQGKVYVRFNEERHPQLVDPAKLRWGWS